MLLVFQEQLSVLRTSLILAHKQQQHQQGTDLYDNVQHPSPDVKHPSAAAVVPALRHLRDNSTPQPEDASPTKADQRKGARQSTPDSSQKRKGAQQQHHQQQQAPSACSTPAEAPAAAPASKHDPSTPAQAGITGTFCSNSNSTTSEQHITEPQQQPQQPQQHTHTLDTAEQLLAAASKVQQLVELLSSSEPSAAADLSVLQWQLTTIYGSLTCGGSSSSRGGMCADGQSFDGSSSGSAVQGQRNGVLQGVACTGRDPLSAACSPATADRKSVKSRATAVVCVDASTGTSPLREPPAAAAKASGGDQAVDQRREDQADTQLQQQPELQQQQDLDVESDRRVAAAAQLFSGAANNSSGGGGKLVAASLAWFYLEPGEPPIMKGPYDAGEVDWRLLPLLLLLPARKHICCRTPLLLPACLVECMHA